MNGKQVDMVMGDGVTVTTRAPGAWHPECGSHPDDAGLFSSPTKNGGARPGSGPKRQPPPSVRVGPAVDGARWYCVAVHQRREADVAARLMDLGFVAVAPEFMDILPAKPARKLPVREVLRAAFPGYILVEFDLGDPDWRRIASQRGVRQVMGAAPERPSAVLPVQAAWMLAQFGPEGVQRRSTLAAQVVAEPIAEGVLVRVSAGPLQGKLGRVVTSNGRAVVLVIAGRRVKMAQVGVVIAGPS
ncbi:transcription termination/antitermination protein NusG [Sandarakinorhabdus sp.]|uniref:transcription termination/antitermination protein NusG n=1 Tax=Sandarakinorhabdus sp. TaxID=1916663 RepID=UPI0035635396